MAKVTINHTIVGQVEAAVNSLFMAEFSELAPSKFVTSEWMEAVYDIIMPPKHRDAVKLLPDNFFYKVSRVNVSYREVSFTVEFSPARVCPAIVPAEWTGRLPWTSNQHTNLHIGKDIELAPKVDAEIQELARRTRELTAKRADAVAAARALLTKHKTLAPALKEWPASWNLLPLSVRDRHKQVVQRTPREKAPEQEEQYVDVSSVTAKIVAARLKGDIK